MWMWQPSQPPTGEYAQDNFDNRCCLRFRQMRGEGVTEGPHMCGNAVIRTFVATCDTFGRTVPDFPSSCLWPALNLEDVDVAPGDADFGAPDETVTALAPAGGRRN